MERDDTLHLGTANSSEAVYEDININDSSAIKEISSHSNIGLQQLCLRIPAHQGIPGNETVDAAAKEATLHFFTSIPHTDAIKYITRKLHNHWQTSWTESSSSKLHEIVQHSRMKYPLQNFKRQDQVQRSARFKENWNMAKSKPVKEYYFQRKWEYDYFVVEDEIIASLLCAIQFISTRHFNIKPHFNKVHIKNYGMHNFRFSFYSVVMFRILRLGVIRELLFFAIRFFDSRLDDKSFSTE
ncbi:hypothetical protein ANN_25758 [Periplaneta americana]|uniref:RNase H type-1 domain-containing protein n=1 Tax=Periplaneta americana TaxID=6978 RepID=A0ABQ8S4K2_PERAM|nr:hypothetical protein ANN_25758 [Periplaneta americana]